jgi:hypothetical protein
VPESASLCRAADGAILNPLHVGELVIDGGTLAHILGTPMEQKLARVGAQCGSVVICRSSPSQKAAIVQMMSEYEMSQVWRPTPFICLSLHPMTGPLSSPCTFASAADSPERKMTTTGTVPAMQACC